MLMIVVVDAATGGGVEAEAALQRSGYVKREVWVRAIRADDRFHEASELKALGFSRYVTVDAWEKGPPT